MGGGEVIPAGYSLAEGKLALLCFLPFCLVFRRPLFLELLEKFGKVCGGDCGGPDFVVFYRLALAAAPAPTGVNLMGLLADVAYDILAKGRVVAYLGDYLTGLGLQDFAGFDESIYGHFV